MITRIQRAAKAPLKVARRHQGAVEFCLLEADVAQLVEQRIRNAKVVSSIPIIGTKTRKAHPR